MDSAVFDITDPSKNSGFAVKSVNGASAISSAITMAYVLGILLASASFCSVCDVLSLFSKEEPELTNNSLTVDPVNCASLSSRPLFDPDAS